VTPARFRKPASTVCLENLGDPHPLRQLFNLARCHQEGHSVESPLQLVFARIRFVIRKLVVILFVAAGFVHFRHNCQVIRMVKVEKQLNRLLASAYLDGLAPNNCREGR
jgi:hypothetical protein